MSSVFDQLTSKAAMKFISQLEGFFKGLPHLPKSWVKFLVKVTPWLILLGGLINLLGGISSLSIGAGMNSVSRMMNPFLKISPVYFILSGLISLTLAFLAFKAFTPLQDRKLMGWIYIFWASILSAVQSILAIIFSVAGVVGSALGILIGLYVLFEIKGEYDGKKVAKKEKKTKK